MEDGEPLPYEPWILGELDRARLSADRDDWMSFWQIWNYLAPMWLHMVNPIRVRRTLRSLVDRELVETKLHTVPGRRRRRQQVRYRSFPNEERDRNPVVVGDRA
jgi:hypothetical protein